MDEENSSVTNYKLIELQTIMDGKNSNWITQRMWKILNSCLRENGMEDSIFLQWTWDTNYYKCTDHINVIDILNVSEFFRETIYRVVSFTNMWSKSK